MSVPCCSLLLSSHSAPAVVGWNGYERMCRDQCSSCRSAIADFAESFYHTWLGGLSKWQRILFVSLIVGSVAVNAFFLDYVIGKSQVAASNPITIVSRTPARTTDTAFPDFTVFMNAVIPGSSSGPNVRPSNSSGPPSPTRFCTILNTPDSPTSCALLDINNSPVAGTDPRMYPHGTKPVPDTYQCINVSVHSFMIRVPGRLWSNHSWLPIQISVDSTNCWVYSTIITTADLAADRTHGAFADVTFRDESSLVFGTGLTTFLQLTAWSEQLLDDSDPNVHVRAATMGTASSVTPSMATVIMDSDSLTNPWMDTTTQQIVYTWKDAIASVFAVLNITVGGLFILFPMTAHAGHQRMWLFDRPKVPVPRPTATAAAATAPVAPAVVSDRLAGDAMDAGSPVIMSSGDADSSGNLRRVIRAPLLRSDDRFRSINGDDSAH